MFSRGVLLAVLCMVVTTSIWKVSAANPVDKCKSCTKGVEGLTKGMRLTADKGWTGGDTSWHEERGLLYSTSETRFIEVMEHACEKKDHNCHRFMSDHEETVEQWFNAGGEGDLFSLLCIADAKVCCPKNTFGAQCQKCLTSETNEGAVCSGNGSCEGGGRRDGSGVCICTKGYKGKYCAKCAKGFFRQNDKCIDFDECKHSQSLCTADEVCHNTAGAFECKCKPQYTRQDGVCTAETPAPTATATSSPESKENDLPDAEIDTAAAETGGQIQKLTSMLTGWFDNSDNTKGSPNDENKDTPAEGKKELHTELMDDPSVDEKKARSADEL
ncbi:hypothetical protein SARC_09145 [Sphaeroforma arctica JP610]|uniref:EGF-like domain-containing protein n=1 Tax=Sphaeroforma arctica JP610 TaxID=667725 RepID=A0A0L0FPI1_9EUKA|nr:hypothetical protein SARC_09145 [Sphaeroforma arctica JP610]KNC78421.1 hypothetical protein SARC_09145 [Sphaeroforma arctica JP610]|eukprot:XP_014152323.1 hypothetical protein SARC_09145 [Sphaeroforma arctica JP610]